MKIGPMMMLRNYMSTTPETSHFIIRPIEEVGNEYLNKNGVQWHKFEDYSAEIFMSKTQATDLMKKLEREKI